MFTSSCMCWPFESSAHYLSAVEQIHESHQELRSLHEVTSIDLLCCNIAIMCTFQKAALKFLLMTLHAKVIQYGASLRILVPWQGTPIMDHGPWKHVGNFPGLSCNQFRLVGRQPVSFYFLWLLWSENNHFVLIEGLLSTLCFWRNERQQSLLMLTFRL